MVGAAAWLAACSHGRVASKGGQMRSAPCSDHLSSRSHRGMENMRFPEPKKQVPFLGKKMGKNFPSGQYNDVAPADGMTVCSRLATVSTVRPLRNMC